MNGELHSRVSQERLQGFKLGMSKCGLAIRKDLIAHGDYTSSRAAPFVDGFVKNGATAIACASDLIAHGVLAELYKLGLNVPRDISVVGFDDIPLARYTTPPLTHDSPEPPDHRQERLHGDGTDHGRQCHQPTFAHARAGDP